MEKCHPHWLLFRQALVLRSALPENLHRERPRARVAVGASSRLSASMSDLQLLFLVLALIYGWECACWLRFGSVAFRSWLGRRWGLVYPAALIGNQNGGF